MMKKMMMKRVHQMEQVGSTVNTCPALWGLPSVALSLSNIALHYDSSTNV